MPAHHRAPNNTPGPPNQHQPTPSRLLPQSSPRPPPSPPSPPFPTPGANCRLPSRSLSCHPPCSNLYAHITGHVHRDGRQTESHTAQPVSQPVYPGIRVSGVRHCRVPTITGGIACSVPPVSRCTEALGILYSSTPEKPPLSSPPHDRRPATSRGLCVYNLSHHLTIFGT
ncbi:uncharacterized protein LY79DRAFT_415080 [Colletotrichum navitas]|uniref:Uncharacterized protein n=1 Tax=Colletotrichum navitas TaxID=681940 RepID=A0AAD8PN35_9PEZI|nr:uncharacterized protein LY79DRAFT_415080 [Colletotrichum navitas]KAK1573226.1 hypothetical protein LY79DRAFT_415080 [Colletotrichum navitas]